MNMIKLDDHRPQSITIELPAHIIANMRKRAAQTSEEMDEPWTVEDLAVLAITQTWEPKPEGWDDDIPF